MLGGLALEDNDKNMQDIENTILNYQKSYTDFYEPFMKKEEYMLKNYVVNYVFKNLFLYEYLTLFKSYMMLVIYFNLIKLYLIDIAAKEQKLTNEMVIECITQFAKVNKYNPDYLQCVREGMGILGYTTMGHMFVMISN